MVASLKIDWLHLIILKRLCFLPLLNVNKVLQWYHCLLNALYLEIYNQIMWCDQVWQYILQINCTHSILTVTPSKMWTFYHKYNNFRFNTLLIVLFYLILYNVVIIEGHGNAKRKKRLVFRSRTFSNHLFTAILILTVRKCEKYNLFFR